MTGRNRTEADQEPEFEFVLQKITVAIIGSLGNCPPR